ncbi:MAG: DUF1761 domain-containing protein [Pseudomonadota bacterium]
MLEFTQLNWLAILVATVAAFLLGGLWYGPIFGRAWMEALGKTEADIEPSPTPFVVSFFTALVTAVVLAALIETLDIASASEGALFGALTGVGFIATAMASDTAFCGWGMKLFAIQAGYRVAYSIIIGALLAGWP